MAGADGRLVLSAVAVWELRLKWHRFHISGQRKGPVNPASATAFASGMGWEVLPLTAHHATTELTDPLEHKDPFDELLLVQPREDRNRRGQAWFEQRAAGRSS